MTLPAGMTINPAAAPGLEACTPEQLAVGTEATSVSCPSRSVIGTAVLSVPGLPPESLKGRIFLGEQAPRSHHRTPLQGLLRRGIGSLRPARAP